MGIKAYIKDFQKSDAPQFKGKSKEKRRDQAVAAYLQAKDDMKEGKGTPRIYAKTYSSLNLKKARELMSPAKHREDGINRIAKGMGISKRQATKHHDDVMKSYGFKPESVNEISVGLRNRYYDAAKKSHDTAGNSAFAASLRKEPYDKEMSTMKKRKKGIKTAKDQAIKNIRGELYKKKTEAMDPMMLGKMQAQAAATQRSNQKKRDEEEKKAMAKKAANESINFIGAPGLRGPNVGPYGTKRLKRSQQRDPDDTASERMLKSYHGEKKTKKIMQARRIRKKAGLTFHGSTAAALKHHKKRGQAFKDAIVPPKRGMLTKMKDKLLGKAHPLFRDMDEGAFYGRDDMVKAYKDEDKKRGMVRVRKQDGNMTHTVTVKRNSADHKKYEKKGYKMDPYFNERTIGQGVEVKKVPAGDPAPQGFKLKKLARVHGGKFDVYHKEKPKVKDAVAGRTMYSDTTTEKLDHQDKPLVKKVVGMLKKASKAHAGQAKSLSKAMTDEGYIKSDKIYPHPQGNLTKMQRRALTALDKRAKKPVTLPGMDMLKKKEKEPTKVGRQSQIVRYEEKGRGPTGIAYSLPKGHPDAENPATRKKYPERQTSAYKKKFFGKDKSSASSVGMKENAFRPPHISLAHMNRMKKHNISFKQADDMLKKKNAKADKPKADKNKVNEVSMNRLGNYIKKRTADIASAGSLMTGDYGIGPAEKKAKRMKGVRDYSRFDRGVKKAVDKMTGKAKVPATNEGMNSYMASTRSMQGVVHARDEDHAREIMRTKHGAKGKIDLRLKGPVSKTTRERRPLGPMDKQESTWYMPTSKEMVVLRNMMKRPIVLGENAENAIDNIPIGSDNLHKIFLAEAKKDPNTDARTMIESWLSDRLKHGDEEAEYLGIRLGLLEGYEADVSKFMNKHDIDHHWSGGKLHVDKKDEKRAMKKLSKKYGGYGPRGAKMMPQVHVKK